LKKNDVIWLFFVKFSKSDQDFLIKIEVVNKDDLLCLCNWPNLRVSHDKKSLLRFKKFNENNQIASIFKKIGPNWG